jgi:hypothetical protein
MNLLRPLILITPCIIPWLLWTCLRISYRILGVIMQLYESEK